MTTDASDRAIVELTIDLGHRLGKRVVAEGVETDRDAELLVEMGCDILQGYLISRPVSCAAFEEAVAARESRSGGERPVRAVADQPGASNRPSARLRSLPPATDGPLALRSPG
jgi:predicted signal transduction protein with EAL and GGDEF domain